MTIEAAGTHSVALCFPPSVFLHIASRLPLSPCRIALRSGKEDGAVPPRGTMPPSLCNSLQSGTGFSPWQYRQEAIWSFSAAW